MAITVEAFENIFLQYYESLYGYAFSIVNNELVAEDIVSDVFYKVWLKKEKLSITASLPAYLYRSIHNACMDNMRRNKMKKTITNDLLHQSTANDITEGVVARLETKELETNLQNALQKLPEQCRTVFQLKRMEELSYREIAERLGISLKTVEAHMSKALRRLRVSLAELLTLLIVLLWN